MRSLSALCYQNWSEPIMKILIHDPRGLVSSAMIQSFESGMLELAVNITAARVTWYREGHASWECD
jgi:hypothetical protein